MAPSSLFYKSMLYIDANVSPSGIIAVKSDELPDELLDLWIDPDMEQTEKLTAGMDGPIGMLSELPENGFIPFKIFIYTFGLYNIHSGSQLIYCKDISMNRYRNYQVLLKFIRVLRNAKHRVPAFNIFDYNRHLHYLKFKDQWEFRRDTVSKILEKEDSLRAKSIHFILTTIWQLFACSLPSDRIPDELLERWIDPDSERCDRLIADMDRDPDKYRATSSPDDHLPIQIFVWLTELYHIHITGKEHLDKMSTVEIATYKKMQRLLKGLRFARLHNIGIEPFDLFDFPGYDRYLKAQAAYMKRNSAIPEKMTATIS